METNLSKNGKLEVFSMTIKDGLENHLLKEQKTFETFRCGLCAMEKSCSRSYHLPCMAHNRHDKLSVYYTHTKKSKKNESNN